MDTQQVDMYLMNNQKNLPPEKIALAREALLNASPEKFQLAMMAEMKDPTTLLLVSIFLGGLGVDRFMLGDVGMGVLKLLTGGLCGILAIIDWCTIMNRTRELNFNRLMTALA
nr:TM2 domain-containing protein [bacterium]